MKQLLATIKLSIIFSIFFSIPIMAFDFQSDGIYYTILSESNHTVEVSQNESNRYSGNIVIPENVTKYGQTYSVISIGKWAFLRCEKLISVTIPATVTHIDEEPFAVTSNLQNIIVNENNPYFTAIDGVLIKKDGTLIVYPTGKTNTSYIIPDIVTIISSRAFQNCNNLLEVKMNNVKKIDFNAFQRCEKLKKVTLSKTLEYIGDQALSGLAIDKITLPDGLKHLGSDAFNGCDNLKSITIPKTVEYIGKVAIGFCNSLEYITVDENNQFYASINGVLYDKEIKTLLKFPSNIQDNEWFEIPSTVTSIGYCAFHTNNNLTRITIPSGVTTIGNGAFYYCKNLSRVTCYAQTPPSTPSEKNTTSDPWGYSGRSEATLYVPKGCAEAYEQFYNLEYSYGSYKYIYPWAYFKTIIEMEEESGINSPCNTQEKPSYYDVYGIKRSIPSKGINIVRKNNSKKKIFIK